MPVYNMSTLKTNIREIPEAWIYKYYAEKHNRKINQPFDGRIIKIKSFINRDTNPSLCIYYNEQTQKYLWYDHSSGQGGDAIDFISGLLSKTYQVTVNTIIRDYEDFIEHGGNLDEYDDVDEIEPLSIKFLGIPRKMKFVDLDFWLQWRIRAEVLTKYNVKALESFKIIKYNHSLDYKPNISYGFYSEKVGLYQIYQPETPKYKYLNTKNDYLIGSEQLKYNSNILIITSGLKDLMALETLCLDLETVAPKSENTIIKYDHIEFLKSKYKHIITMFDNDDAGIKAMENYKRIYNIPYIRIHLEKDIADNNKRHGTTFCRNHYTLNIDKKINNAT